MLSDVFRLVNLETPDVMNIYWEGFSEAIAGITYLSNPD